MQYLDLIAQKVEDQKCECLASKTGDLIDLLTEVEDYIENAVNPLADEFKILELIDEEENLLNF